ncbi:hypothetical protein K502DRAFT_340082 [Neoconidiobolus thromboides FSU 785]|nr:hypothetical protein K502DRAFT_340082 [Neoconidiobolus thromboides FSU 785]
MNKFFLITILFIAFLSIIVECKKSSSDASSEEVSADSGDASSEEDSSSSKKKHKKGKTKAAAAIDTRELEGVWKTTFYFNHTESRVIARSCQKVDEIPWSISGTQWTQQLDVDPLYDSNGRWGIKELIQGDNINFVKIELLKNSIDSIEPCIGYMREGTKLFMMFNSTNPSTCPQKFQFFNDVCSNTVDYTVSECQSGKCLKDPREVEYNAVASNAHRLYAPILIFLPFLVSWV